MAHTSDSDQSYDLEEDEVRKNIKEQDDFDNFLNVYEEASNYYNFYFLKWVSACDVYSLIKENLVRYPNFDPDIHKMIDEKDHLWCCKLIFSADPETKITESKIYFFYVRMMSMNYSNNNYLKKNKIKLPTRPWKVQ